MSESFIDSPFIHCVVRNQPVRFEDQCCHFGNVVIIFSNRYNRTLE